MRFNVIINQEKCLKMGINKSEAALMSLLNELSSWAELKVIDGQPYYHLSRNKVLEELPFFFSKSDTVYRYFKNLNDLGLIDYVAKNRKDFVRLSAKGKQWNRSILNSEKNPSLPQTRKKIRANSEKNPNFEKIENADLQLFTFANSEKNPTYNNNYTSNNSLRGEILKLKEENPMVFDAFFNGPSYYENIMRQLKISNPKLKFQKDVVPLLLNWLMTHFAADNLNAPTSKLKAQCLSYLKACVGNKTNKQKEAENQSNIYLSNAI